MTTNPHYEHLPLTAFDKYEEFYKSLPLLRRIRDLLWWRFSYLKAFFFGGPCQAELFLLGAFNHKFPEPLKYCLPRGVTPPPGLYMEPPVLSESGLWIVTPSDNQTRLRVTGAP